MPSRNYFSVLLSLAVLAVASFAQPVGQVSPSNLDFGTVLIGSTSRQIRVTLTNIGDATMAVPTVSTSGPFEVAVNTCKKALKPGKRCNIQVTYTPQAVETDSGSVTFTDNASNSPQTVSLSGTGTNLQVLHQFDSRKPYGEFPQSNVISDSNGNLYGTTSWGGVCSKQNCGGTVFKLSAAGTETVLYAFCSLPNCQDGADPITGLVFDTQGNLYGTTFKGGDHGAGTVFRLAPNGNETVLHSFAAYPNDGVVPDGGLVIDAQGNLYGTTGSGGSFGHGTVFVVTQGGAETVLYSFLGSPSDGIAPTGDLLLDSQGDLYGTTVGGGAYGYGTVFRLTTSGNESVLYSFAGSPSDGAAPTGGLIADEQGNLYGTTSVGGPYDCSNYIGSGCGTVFQLTPSGTETVLYSFANSPDGATPMAGLVDDGHGNLYGTTQYGGSNAVNCGSYGCGAVFRVTLTGIETLLYSFTGNADGFDPVASLVFDPQGALLGTTSLGGYGHVPKLGTRNDPNRTRQLCKYEGCGVVFKIVP